MIKTIIPASTLLSLSLSSFTYAANIPKPEGWYTALSWGNAFNQVFDSSKTNNNANNPLINASVGYKKGSFRIEGQYGYQSINLHYYYYPNNSLIRTFQGHMHSLAVNGYYDFDNQTAFSPYVGIGIVGQKEYFEHNFFHNTSSDISYNPALHLGVRAYMTENLAFDIGYHANRFNDGVGSIGIVYHF